MELNLNKMIDKIKQSDFVEKFIKELSKELKNGEMKMEFNLTEDEELEEKNLNSYKIIFNKNYRILAVEKYTL